MCERNMGNKIDYEKIYKLEAQNLAKISYNNRLKVWLGRSMGEIKGSHLYGIIAEAFEGQVDDEMTLDEVRIQTLLKNMLRGGTAGIKAIELTYKIDGTLNNVEADVDLEEIEESTEGIN